jgi:hypothetical protein
MATNPTIPPPPAGYTLQGSVPPPPAGYTLQSGSAPAPRTAMDSASDVVKGIWQNTNPIQAIKGLIQLTNHPYDSYMQDAAARKQVYQKAEDHFKKGDYADGAAHLIYSLVPFLGPAASEAGSNFENGKTALATGQSIGLGLNVAAPEAIKNIPVPAAVKSAVGNVADRMYQSALKPPPGSYTNAEVGQLVKTGLDQGIPVSKAGADKLGTLIKDYGNAVRSMIASDPTATVNKFAVASRLGGSMKQFATQVTPEADLAAVSDAGQEFLRNQPGDIAATTAQDLKQGTYKQIKGKAYGELKSASVEAQKALARGIKEELEAQFPEIQNLNAAQGKFINLDEALDRALNRTANRDLFSLGGKIATGAGATIGSAFGFGGAAEGSAAALLMHHIMTDPMVQSKLAIALNTATKGKLPLNTAAARVAGYSNALGNAVASTSQPNADQGDSGAAK